MLHSEFRSLMLESPEQPLPKAAAGLAAPLTSLLPLVSVQDPGKRVRTLFQRSDTLTVALQHKGNQQQGQKVCSML